MIPRIRRGHVSHIVIVFTQPKQSRSFELLQSFHCVSPTGAALLYRTTIFRSPMPMPKPKTPKCPAPSLNVSVSMGRTGRTGRPGASRARAPPVCTDDPTRHARRREADRVQPCTARRCPVCLLYRSRLAQRQASKRSFFGGGGLGCGRRPSKPGGPTRGPIQRPRRTQGSLVKY